MKNPVYDPRSEDVIKRLNELGQEQDDPAFLREAKNLVRSANRLYIPSGYRVSYFGAGLDMSFLYLEMLGARHEIREENYVPSFSDMERFSQMYRRSKEYKAQQEILNQPRWTTGFRVVRSKA